MSTWLGASMTAAAAAIAAVRRMPINIFWYVLIAMGRLWENRHVLITFVVR
jgi:hypothetical protein